MSRQIILIENYVFDMLSLQSHLNSGIKRRIIMQIPNLSRRKAGAIANGLFFVLLGIIIYTDAWWPGIILAIGVNIGIRQFFAKREKDLYITLVIISLIGVISFFNISSTTLISFLFILGGIYLILREYFFFDSICLNKKNSECHDDRNEIR